VKGVPSLEKHPVIAHFAITCVMTAIVLPGWWFYIVPKANKTWKDHLELIRRSEEQSARDDQQLEDEEVEQEGEDEELLTTQDAEA